MTQEELVEALTEAEKIVKDIADPELRAVAFGRILDYLLSSQSPARKKLAQPVPKKPSTLGAVKGGPGALLNNLVGEKFFKEQRSSTDILKELATRGHYLKTPDITQQLTALVRSQVLRRQKKSPAAGGKEVWPYSEW